jgi:hypothetical protein
VERSGELILSVIAGFAESGSNSSLSYTGEDGAVNMLKFRRR